MPDPVWHYTENDEEHGPITAAQLKGLATSGKLRADDLVWKEGMEEWVPANQIPGLFPKEATQRAAAPPQPAAPPADPPPPPAPPQASETPAEPAAGLPNIKAPEPWKARKKNRGPDRLIRALTLIGRPLLAFGLLLVIIAQGCDTVGDRYADRLEARYELAQNRFSDDYQRDRLKLEADKKKIQDNENLESEVRSDRLDVVNEKLSDLREEERDARSELLRGRWFDMQADSRNAQHSNRAWGFFRSIVLLFGSLVLTAGLMIVGFTGQGADRWICLAILLIIVISLYGGGLIVGVGG